MFCLCYLLLQFFGKFCGSTKWLILSWIFQHLTHFRLMSSLIPQVNIRKTGFLLFSGSIKKNYWPHMGQLWTFYYYVVDMNRLGWYFLYFRWQYCIGQIIAKSQEEKLQNSIHGQRSRVLLLLQSWSQYFETFWYFTKFFLCHKWNDA